jgi:hypothetical protein
MGEYYGAIEMVFSFGVILAILIWQLVVTRRSIRKDRERAQREARDGALPPAGRPGQPGDKN